MFKKTLWMASCTLVLAGFGAHAATVDDVIAMAQKGEPEDKQVAAVDSTPGDINVGASDIIRLREAKVPEKVIVAMLRHVSKDSGVAHRPVAPMQAPPQGFNLQQQPQQQQPYANNPYANNPQGNLSVRPPVAPMIPQAPQQNQGNNQAFNQPQDPQRALPPQGPPEAIRNPNQDGQLTIENLDDRTWSYMYEPAIQTIWISLPSQGSRVEAHSSTTLSMRPGHYTVRFSGMQEGGYPLAINGGERSAINVSRVADNTGEALNVSLFEHGERRASGRLVNLNALPPEGAPTQTYVDGGTTYYSGPPTTVYYGSPYYYGGGYYGGYYRPYYGGTQFNLGLNFGGGGGYGGHHHR